MQVGKLVAYDLFRSTQRGRIAKADFNQLGVAADATVAHIFFPQHGADIARKRFGLFSQRGLHVHLQHEVHATAQVQTQIHGGCMQRRQPSRRPAEQIERDHVARLGTLWRQRFLDHVFGFELGLGRLEANLERCAFQRYSFRCNASRLERILHAGQGGCIDLDSGFGRRDLDGWRFAKEIGQRVQRRDHQRHQNDDVLPGGVAIHGAPECGLQG